MSSSLDGKLEQSPKQINVFGMSWFTNHEFYFYNVEIAGPIIGY